jgi:branched-chain amino acid transport system permease protein
VAGALFAFAKGSDLAGDLAVGRSIDGLVMVLLGGVQTLAGPVVGRGQLHLAAGHRSCAQTDYWRALLGGMILLLVLAFPQGIAGACWPFWTAEGRGVP